MRVALISAETFEFDSRGLNICRALAADGHQVDVLALPEHGLAAEEGLGPSLRVSRIDVDRRITSALRPLPEQLRSAIARAIGLDPAAVILSAAQPSGLDRLRHPLRRLLELVAHARRVGPWTDAVVRAAPDADVFHTKALPCLPVARRAARRLGARYVYDLADYQTEAARIARLPRIFREFARRLERRWARDASGALAASPEIADLASRKLDLERPRVVMNCPPAWRPTEQLPRSSRLREALDLPTDRPLVLHHGQFKLDRGIEELVEAADQPALRDLGAAVVFLGFGRLEAYLAAAVGARPGLLYVVPGVPIDDLLEYVSDADVGYLGCPPRSLNLQLTLPTKLFECLMAGVPVVAADGTAMARLIAREGVGRSSAIESAATLAEDLSALLTLPPEERAALRLRCRSVALAKYTWELNAPQVTDLYRELGA